MTTLPQALNTERVSTQYDERHGVLIVRYHNELSGESVREMYAWCLEAIAQVGLAMVRGVIYDFSEVSRFTFSNLAAVQRGSLEINGRIDLSEIPVALVARSLLQEQHLAMSMGATPDTERKKIVPTIQAGMQFISTWHRKARSGNPALPDWPRPARPS